MIPDDAEPNWLSYTKITQPATVEQEMAVNIPGIPIRHRYRNPDLSWGEWRDGPAPE